MVRPLLYVLVTTELTLYNTGEGALRHARSLLALLVHGMHKTVGCTMSIISGSISAYTSSHLLFQAFMVSI